MTTETNMDYWAKVSEISDSYKKWFEAEEKYLQRNMNRNSEILEVGCGDGRSLEYILNKGEGIFGIDIDEHAIIPAKKKFVDNPIVSVSLGDGRDLMYKDNYFDYVLCMTTPANFGEDRDKFYSEMKRVVKEDGEIIISVFNEDAFDERMKVYTLLAKDRIKKIIGNTFYFDKILGGNRSEGFSREKLEKIFEKNKLNVLEIKKEGIGYFCRLGKGRKE